VSSVGRRPPPADQAAPRPDRRAPRAGPCPRTCPWWVRGRRSAAVGSATSSESGSTENALRAVSPRAMTEGRGGPGRRARPGRHGGRSAGRFERSSAAPPAGGDGDRGRRARARSSGGRRGSFPVAPCEPPGAILRLRPTLRGWFSSEDVARSWLRPSRAPRSLRVPLR